MEAVGTKNLDDTFDGIDDTKNTVKGIVKEKPVSSKPLDGIDGIDGILHTSEKATKKSKKK